VADLVASGIVPLLAKFHLFGKAACADEEAGKKKNDAGKGWVMRFKERRRLHNINSKAAASYTEDLAN